MTNGDFRAACARLRIALAAVVLLALGIAPGLANAQEAIGASCQAATPLVRGIDHPVLPDTDAWSCGLNRQPGLADVAWVFFTPDDVFAAPEKPTHFVTDIGNFSRVSLIAVGPDGPVRARTYAPDEVARFVNGPKFALPLPDMRGATGLIVGIEHPWSPSLMTEARIQSLTASGGELGWSHETMLSIALLLGLMATPLAYHAAFHRILRSNFVIWQMLSLLSLMAFVLVSSGLVHGFVTMPLSGTLAARTIAILLANCCAAAFLVSYLERDVLSERTRLLVRKGIVTTAVIGVFALIPAPMLRPWASVLPLIASAPVLAIAGATCVAALRAGSRDVRVQIACMTALLVVNVALAVRSAGVPLVGDLASEIMYLAIAAQVGFSSVAVLSRVDIMRRERERVNARLDALTNLIDLDPLTGIFNRRALEKRFAELRSDGFHALAVIDLDHFKRVNDRFGHATGDRVLQEVAAVLSADADTIAFRMGGEEFVVMLRGAQVQQRAEQMRRAITIRIANEIEGIDNPVTASMGLIESPPGGAAVFRQLYKQADRLLYEAKNGGRNRLITERIQVFAPPRRERRVEDRRTGT